ncbi:type II secretion system minor pseudopilin GspK [Roseateles sp.]|uniref:type II secretion system minor pseudopilin GspK n=1 Tax=Roseateles sp. TaxID=1971397 RepID=UPI0025D5A56B|nr:type II secretion system minor pseudopilin GspK [Roseateles sp.]MBV8037314.1 type II secretion system minor pseudopilin GspK [Roseateles sp.]
MKTRLRQRGAALLTAMIIVTLIASLAAGMVWQQYRAVQIEAADRARAQSAWILQGALDWARLILLEDAKQNRNKPVDHLGEPWAVPLAEARLSTFLATAPLTADDGPEAFLSGSIEDAQSRYNLRALLGGPKVPELEQRVLERLCSQVNAPPGTAALIIAGLRDAFPTPASGASQPPADSGPLQPAGLDQLSWFGLDADTLQRLRPYVVLLPKATPVNLNTAPREVIAALFDGVDLATAERLVQGRKAKPLQDVTSDAAAYLPAAALAQATGTRASVASSFFVVTGRLRLDERQLEQRSLIERRDLNMVVLARERINQLLNR